MFGDIIKKILRYMNPTVIFPRLKSLMEAWNSANVKERAILAVVFAPTFLCIGGVLFTVISFVLFVLPSFVIKLITWLLMAALFGAGGTYCYEHLTGQKMKKESFFSSSFSFSRWETGQRSNDRQGSSESFYDVGWKNVDESAENQQGMDEDSMKKKWFDKFRNAARG